MAEIVSIAVFGVREWETRNGWYLWRSGREWRVWKMNDCPRVKAVAISGKMLDAAVSWTFYPLPCGW